MKAPIKQVLYALVNEQGEYFEYKTEEYEITTPFINKAIVYTNLDLAIKNNIDGYKIYKILINPELYDEKDI